MSSKSTVQKERIRYKAEYNPYEPATKAWQVHVGDFGYGESVYAVGATCEEADTRAFAAWNLLKGGAA